MGISMLTAMIIQSRGDDVKCEVAGPNKDGKYIGWINLYQDSEYDHALLDSGPAFDSKDAALEKMESVVKQIRNMDLSPEQPAGQGAK